jgi:hypothetical protein
MTEKDGISLSSLIFSVGLDIVAKHWAIITLLLVVALLQKFDRHKVYKDNTEKQAEKEIKRTIQFTIASKN